MPGSEFVQIVNRFLSEVRLLCWEKAKQLDKDVVAEAK
jgi:hypothetical protein